MTEIWASVIDFFQTTGITIAKAVALTVFGIIGIKLLMKLLRKIYLKSSMENSVGSFILSILNVFLYVGLFFGICGIVKISTAGIIATLSTVVLAISLSLQESLKNISSGLIIVGTKPFKEGDLVEVSTCQGRILEIRMFSTKLVTLDNKVITVPNSQIVNANVTNFSANSTRRVELVFSVAYGSDIKKIKQIISAVVLKHSKVLKTPQPIIRLIMHGESSLNIDCKVWALTEDYWDVLYDINEMVLEAFVSNNVEIPFNQMDIHIKEDNHKLVKKSIVKEEVDNKKKVVKEETKKENVLPEVKTDVIKTRRTKVTK